MDTLLTESMIRCFSSLGLLYSGFFTEASSGSCSSGPAGEFPPKRYAASVIRISCCVSTDGGENVTLIVEKGSQELRRAGSRNPRPSKTAKTGAASVVVVFTNARKKLGPASVHLDGFGFALASTNCWIGAATISSKPADGPWAAVDITCCAVRHFSVV